MANASHRAIKIRYKMNSVYGMRITFLSHFRSSPRCIKTITMYPAFKSVRATNVHFTNGHMSELCLMYAPSPTSNAVTTVKIKVTNHIFFLIALPSSSEYLPGAHGVQAACDGAVWYPTWGPTWDPRGLHVAGRIYFGRERSTGQAHTDPQGPKGTFSDPRSLFGTPSSILGLRRTFMPAPPQKLLQISPWPPWGPLVPQGAKI